ncbi:MAG: hypothetical protein ABSH50_27250 [Bryobacteraceae bacterium]|jgi:hypothetical protein
MPSRIPTVRKIVDNATVLEQLGLLSEFAGTWHGSGFNLVARPDFEDHTNVFLELNLTSETTTFSPISSSIPNRGFAQPDIELFGLTYLVQISDAITGGALHIEPGIWVTQPSTSEPPLSPPDGSQLVTRMANIPHGNSLLAQGIATPFSGPPTISPGANPIAGANPAFSLFPSFNTTPIDLAPGPGLIAPGVPLGAAIFSAGTSEAQSKPGGGFSQFTLSNPVSPTNTRTPLGNQPSVLPPAITQTLLNDPVTLLQQTIQEQIAQDYSFSGVAINISTAQNITFINAPFINGSPTPAPATPVNLAQAGGGIENLGFLLGPSAGTANPLNPPNNAATVLFYATFWLEKLTHPTQPPSMQLQYAQMTILNFPALIPGQPNFSWPHVQVATLQKTFG